MSDKVSEPMTEAREILSMTYVSHLLWHFVRDRKSENGTETLKSSFDILNEDILQDNGRGLLLRYPRPDANAPWNHFYVRNVQLGIPESKLNDLGSSTAQEDSVTSTIPIFKDLLEPRAVCFADIPFNFLPVHME